MTDQELAELDLAVARAEGFPAELVPPAPRCIAERPPELGGTGLYQPTRDGAEAMRLLTTHSLTVGPAAEDWWSCRANERDGKLPAVLGYAYGPTPAIAICRAVVAIRGSK